MIKRQGDGDRVGVDGDIGGVVVVVVVFATLANWQMLVQFFSFQHNG